MIHFSYNIIWDIRWFIRNKKNIDFLKSINVVIFPFKLKNIFYVYGFFKNINDISYEKNVNVYFLTSGTTGSYTYPNKIFICPVDIEKFGGFTRVLSHELAHLELGENVEKLSHKEKEKRVHMLEYEIGLKIKNI